MRLMFASLILFSLQAWSAPVEVVKLYDQQSNIPGVLIPLKVKGDLIASGGTVFEVVVNSGGVDCRVMKDPFVTNVFLLRCADPATVSLRFKVNQAGKLVELVYGPLEVKLPTADYEVIQPDDPNSPDVIAGKQLFNSYCVNCHNPPTLKRSRNAAQIKAAMTQPNDRYGMNYLNAVLSSQDLKKLEAYLKSI